MRENAASNEIASRFSRYIDHGIRNVGLWNGSRIPSISEELPRVIHPEVKLNLSFVGALCVWMSKLFVFPPQLMTLEE